MAQNSLLDLLPQAGNRLFLENRGLGDALWTLGKNAAVQPFAGLSGLLSLARGRNLADAVDRINATQAYAGGPVTTEGARNLQAVGDVINYALAPLKQGVDAVGDQSPLAGAALAGLGAVVDPFKGAGRAVKAGKLSAETVAKFGQKAAREAAIQKKVIKAAADVAQEAEIAAATSAGKAPSAKRQKVPADYWRTTADQLGDQAVLDMVRDGQHLKPDGAGGYIGAPRTVDSPQALGAMRRTLDGQFSDAVNAVREADPAGLGTWYDRAKGGIALSAEPHQLDRVLDQHAVYSAGVSPESELGFALKHLNSRAVGEPVMAYRGAPMRKLDDAVAADEAPSLGFKIGEYRVKNDPREPNTGLFGVNDFRAAQGFGYTTPDGRIWKGGVSPTMHPFMDGETALMVDRANANAVGGRTDWAGPHLQELPWVLGKAQDIYGRGKNGRFAGDPAEGMAAAIREANNTAQDYFYKHAAAATHEAVPGASTGHVPGLLSASPEEKLAYGNVGRWDMPTSYTLSDAPTVGIGNRDALYSAVGFRQLPSVPSAGAYVNSAGLLETNPVTLARPLVDFPTSGVGQMAESTDKVMNAIERFRAAMDAQEAGAFNLPNSMSAAKQKKGFVLDSRTLGQGDPALGLQPTGDQMKNLAWMLEGTGYVPSATSRGVTVFPVSDKAIKPQALKNKLGEWLTAEFPSELLPARVNTGYVPGIGEWGPSGVVPTPAFSGRATAGLLDTLADVSPTVTKNMGESEAIRRAIRAKIERDAALPGARKDIQNMRNFFAEADWPKAVEMIRAGAKPAAALAALGYSLNSMAAENDR